MSHPRIKIICKAVANFAKNNILLLVTLVGIILGIVLGLTLRPYSQSHDLKAWIQIWGELFFRMLQIIILPLIVSCIIVGMTSMDIKKSGKVGTLTITYVLITQIIAILLGVIVAFAVQPGVHLADDTIVDVNSTYVSYTDMFTDFLRNMFPDNIVRTTIQSTHTTYEYQNTIKGNATNEKIIRTLTFRDGMNTMGVVVTSCVVAFAISKNRTKAKALLDVSNALYNVTFTILNGILWFSPIGVASLIAGTLIEVEDLESVWKSLGLYILAVAIGNLVHTLIILPLILFLFVRKNPYRYYLHLLEGLFVSMSLASSAPAMTHMLKANVEKLGVNPAIANFVMPIEVVLNRDGSALFIMIAVMFLAQSYGIVLSFGQYALTGLLTLLLSAAVANVPSGSIMVLFMVASAVNIPVNDRLGLLMSVEWLADRIRTSSNAIGNGFGCPIVEAWCKVDLKSCKSCQCRHPEDDNLDDEYGSKEKEEKISLRSELQNTVSNTDD